MGSIHTRRKFVSRVSQAGLVTLVGPDHSRAADTATQNDVWNFSCSGTSHGKRCVSTVLNQEISSSKISIASIAQTRNNVGIFIEFFIDRRRVNRDIGMRLIEGFYPFGSGNQTNESDSLSTFVFQLTRRFGTARPGRQHRVDQNTSASDR